MSENSRIFPRYTTRNMKIEFDCSDLKGKDFVIENVSLGGLRVSSLGPLRFDQSFNASLRLGSQEFHLMAYTVWNQAITTEDENSFNYGFRLVFSEEDHYRRWMTFMKALHQHKKNSEAKNS